MLSFPTPNLISPKIFGSAGVRPSSGLLSTARFCSRTKPSVFCDASMATKVKLTFSFPVGSEVVPIAPMVPVLEILERLPDWSLIAYAVPCLPTKTALILPLLIISFNIEEPSISIPVAETLREGKTLLRSL